MKIAILTICTGKYTMFFEGLYNSCEEFFLKSHEKKYFVFTDGEILSKSNVIKIHQQKLGWPFDTMMRFHMFNQFSEMIGKYDYVFFLNANMIMCKEVGEEILPNELNENLMGVLHPGYYNKPIERATFERNPGSVFCVNYNEGKHYYQGCFNGGKGEDFMKMSNILANKIDVDMANGIIPIWHDESALNWYFRDKNVLSLSPSYAYPEVWGKNLYGEVHDVEKIAMQIDKSKFGGGTLRM